MNFTAYAMSCVAAAVFLAVLQKFLTSSQIFVLGHLCSVLASLGLYMTHDKIQLVPVWILIISFGTKINFCLCYYATYEFFPAEIKGQVYSICNMFAWGFTIFSPMLAEVVSKPIVFITVSSTISGVLSFFLYKSTDTPLE